MDLAQVTDELYALSPDDFRAARDERASEARAAGDKDLARAITALRRPVVSAWLVNLLAREAAAQIDELLALGESLRDAQQALAGDRLRELSTERRRLVTALVGDAKRLAERDGRTVSLQVEREVEATLQAVLADPDAAAAVRDGRLASPLSYAGLGAGEVATARTGGRSAGPRPAVAATAVSTERKVPRERVTRGEGAAGPAEREAAQQAAREAAAAERREREAAAARQAAEDAAGAEAAARAALDDAERAAAGARSAHEAVRERAERLDRELAEALAEQSRTARALRDAQRGREAAVRALDAAAKRLARARQAAGRFDQPSS